MQAITEPALAKKNDYLGKLRRHQQSGLGKSDGF
jgi:hypothetical protein